MSVSLTIGSPVADPVDRKSLLCRGLQALARIVLAPSRLAAKEPP
jgi:hypothetical protein